MTTVRERIEEIGAAALATERQAAAAAAAVANSRQRQLEAALAEAQAALELETQRRLAGIEETERSLQVCTEDGGHTHYIQALHCNRCKCNVIHSLLGIFVRKTNAIAHFNLELL